jgi:transposase
MFPGSIKVYVAREKIDLRKGYDGLGMLVQDTLEMDPFSGYIFVFFNKHLDKMKALYWDRNGFCIWQKRLEKGTFRIPTIINSRWEVSFQELQCLLAGIDLRRLPPQVDCRNHILN